MKKPRQKSRQKMLGLAIGDKSILAAELCLVGARSDDAAKAPTDAHAAESERYEASRLAEFFYGEAGFVGDEALGERLGKFLSEHGFSARSAVVGIPAKWVVVKPKQVPPAESAVVADTLRLQAEGDFAGSVAELVYDYAGEPSPSEPRQILLMATPRRYVDQVMAIARGARLSAAAMTPSAASLGWAASRTSGDAMVLLLGEGGAEFTALTGASPSVLRHLGPAPQSPPGPMFLSELRRTASLLPPAAAPLAPHANGNNGERAGGRELLIWNGFSLDAKARQAVGDSLGVPVRAGELEGLGVSAAPAAQSATQRNPGHFAPAVALALAGLAGTFELEGADAARPASAAAPVDFLHSRLAPPKERRFDRRVLWGSAAAAVLLLIFAVMLYQQITGQKQADAINAELQQRAPDIKQAKFDVGRWNFVNLWHGGSPRFLPCLHDLTADIPDDGAIYLTNFEMHDDMQNNDVMKGSIQGKTNSNDRFQELVSKMTASGHYSGIGQSFVVRENPREGRQVVFTIRFTYVGHDPAAPPAVKTTRVGK